MQRVWVRYLIRGSDPRPDGTGAIQTLALEPLPVTRLQVPGSDIIDNRVAEYICHSLRGRDVFPATADDHTKLDLPVHLIRNCWIHQYRVSRANHRRRGLGKEDWVLGHFARPCAGDGRFQRVFYVVASQTDNILARA